MAWWARAVPADAEGPSRVHAVGVRGVAAVHAGVWLVRGTGIALGDRALGFKVVHTVLALVSIGLAGWVATAVGAASRSEARREAVGAN